MCCSVYLNLINQTLDNPLKFLYTPRRQKKVFICLKNYLHFQVLACKITSIHILRYISILFVTVKYKTKVSFLYHYRVINSCHAEKYNKIHVGRQGSFQGPTWFACVYIKIRIIFFLCCGGSVSFQLYAEECLLKSTWHASLCVWCTDVGSIVRLLNKLLVFFHSPSWEIQTTYGCFLVYQDFRGIFKPIVDLVGSKSVDNFVKLVHFTLGLVSKSNPTKMHCYMPHKNSRSRAGMSK